MVDKRLKLLFPSKPQSLNTIRKEVQDLIAGTPYQTREHDILLVVSEACTNVIRHAYAKSHRRPLVIVECILKMEAFVIMVCDRGKGLAQSEDRPIFSEDGGFGFFLMQRLADRFKCHSSPGSGTVVEVMFKNPRYLSSRIKEGMHDAAGQASVSCLNLASMINYSRKLLLFYRANIGLETLLQVDFLKPYWRVRMFLYFMKSEVDDLKKALKNTDYELCGLVTGRICEQAKLIERDFHRLSTEERPALERDILYIFSELSELRQELEIKEDEQMPGESGICFLVMRSKISNLIAETSNHVRHIVDGRAGCWISLDEGPLRPI